MSDPSKRCLNCDDTFQNFQKPTGDALTVVIGRVGRADASKYWRCSHPGCLRVQNYYDYQDGFDLPPSFG